MLPVTVKGSRYAATVIAEGDMLWLGRNLRISMNNY